MFLQGGYTVRWAGLSWVNVSRRVAWSKPYKDIFIDLDGTLTGMGPGTVMPFYAFNKWPECVRDSTPNGALGGGLVCSDSVVVRRLSLDNHVPASLDFVNLNISSSAGADVVKFRPGETYGWAWPMVVARRSNDSRRDYSVLFQSLSDWQMFNLRYSEPDYIAPGEWSRLAFSWWGSRYRNRVFHRLEPGREVPPLTAAGDVPNAASMFGTGTWLMPAGATNASVAAKTWTVALSTGNLNGSDPRYKASFLSSPSAYSLNVAAIQCGDTACGLPGGGMLLSNNTVAWSDPASWPAGRLPAAGEDVTIAASLNMVLDVSPPPLGRLDVLGRLACASDAVGALTLVAASIVVWGELECGTSAAPRAAPTDIVLTGSVSSPTVVVDNNIWAGNKVLLVMGALRLHGAPRAVPWTRLAAPAAAGDTTLTLAAPVESDWVPGDTLAIGPTEWDLPLQVEEATIASVSGSTVTLATPLRFLHYAGPPVAGGGSSAAARAAAPLGAPVAVLGRTLRLRGNVSATPVWTSPPNSNAAPTLGPDTYGGTLLVSQISRPTDPTSSWRVGSADLRFVELRGMGKGYTDFPAVGIYYGAFNLDPAQDGSGRTSANLGDRGTHPVNRFEGCAIVRPNGLGVEARGARNLRLADTLILRPLGGGLVLDRTSTNATLLRNVVFDSAAPLILTAPGTTPWIWPTAAFFVDAPFVGAAAGNIVGGAADAGFALHAEPTCASSGPAAAAAGFPPLGVSPQWMSNEVHGAVVGVFLLPNTPPATGAGRGTWCGLRAGGFTVFKAAHIGILAIDSAADIALVNVTVVDAHVGVSLNYLPRDTSTAPARSDVVDALVVGWGGSTASGWGVAPGAGGGTCGAPSTRCRAAVSSDVAATSSTVCNSVLGGDYARVGIIGPLYTNRARSCSADGSLKTFAGYGAPPVCRPPTRPYKPCSNSWEKRYGLGVGARAAALHLSRVTFAGFFGAGGDGAVAPCGRSAAYAHNPAAVDAAIPVVAAGIAWDGVPQAGMFAFAPLDTIHPPLNRPADYGGNGAASILLTDSDGSLTGTPGSSVLGPNPALAEAAPACSWVAAWWGSLCAGLPFRLAIIESVDSDRATRNLGALVISRLPAAAAADAGSVSWGNRSTAWEGPRAELCAMRFPYSQYHVLLRPGAVQHLLIPSTEPGQMRFHFFSPDPAEAVLLKVFLQRPNSIAVYARPSGALIQPKGATNPAGATLADLPQLSDAHGANLFDPRARHLTLLLRGQLGGTLAPIDVVRLPSVQISLTLRVSLTAFFSPAGVLANLATLLGIPAERLKVVSVSAVPAARGLLALLLPAPSAARALLAGDSNNTALAVEVLPRPEATVAMAEPPPDTNVTSGDAPDPGWTNFTALGGAPPLAPDAAAQRDTVLEMVTLATAAQSLADGGAMGSLGGFTVLAVSVAAPDFPAVSPPPAQPTRPQGGSTAAMSAGAVAGAVVGAVAAAGAAAALLVLRARRAAGAAKLGALVARPLGGGGSSRGARKDHFQVRNVLTTAVRKSEEAEAAAEMQAP